MKGGKRQAAERETGRKGAKSNWQGQSDKWKKREKKSKFSNIGMRRLQSSFSFQPDDCVRRIDHQAEFNNPQSEIRNPKSDVVFVNGSGWAKNYCRQRGDEDGDGTGSKRSQP